MSKRKWCVHSVNVAAGTSAVVATGYPTVRIARDVAHDLASRDRDRGITGRRYVVLEQHGATR